jgi:hypothetical protein
MTMGDDELTKLTVFLIPKAWDALNGARQYEENTRTDTINRALILYGLVCEFRAQNCELLIRGSDGEIRALRWHEQ